MRRTLAVAAQSLGAGSLSGSGMEPPGRRVVQLLYPDLWAYNFKSGRFSIQRFFKPIWPTFERRISVAR